MNKYIMEQNGRSMIEMLGVLAIVGVLSVAGIAGYSKAMAKYKTNKLIDQVSHRVVNVRTKFAAQGNYKGLNPWSAYDLGIYPEETTKSCSLDEDGDVYLDCIRNAFGGTFFITTMINGERDFFGNNYFVIVTTGITEDTCSALLMSDWGYSLETRDIGSLLAYMVFDYILEDSNIDYSDLNNLVVYNHEAFDSKTELVSSEYLCGKCSNSNNECSVGIMFADYVH